MTEKQPSESRTFRPTPGFLARAKRMDDAMHLRKPDRVPVAPLVVHYYPTRIKGISNKDAMYEQGRMFEAWKEVTIKHGWDAAPSPGSVLPAGPLDALGITQIKWPGGALADDQPFQWNEQEYMTQGEYDEMLADANIFALTKLWPRISTTLAPVAEMVRMTPPLVSLSNAYVLPAFLGGMLSQPPLRELLKKLLQLADEVQKNQGHAISYAIEMTDLGFPIPWGPCTFPSFDWVSDTLRGLKGSSLDMYQKPDKLLAAIDFFTPLNIGAAVMWAEQVHNKGVFVPMHRGAAGFMSDKQFAKFYWPSFKTLMMGLIEAGLTPIPLFEGDYTPRLEYLAELPPGKVVGHFDRVDRKKAKKLLGDVMCFWGNVPASLMVAGTPQQVEDDVKQLIDTFGDNGGLIIDGTMGLPDESREENVQALTEAVHEYGVNRRCIWACEAADGG